MSINLFSLSLLRFNSVFSFPSATNSESTTQSIIDQTPKSTDLTQYPLAFTDKAPTITNQLGLTTTEVSNELRAEINSTDSTNLTDSSATATLNNGTFIAGSDVLPTHATTEPTTIHQNGELKVAEFRKDIVHKQLHF